MAVLGEVLATLAVGILRWWMERSDIQRGERQRIALAQLGLEQAALEWTVAALRDPATADRAARLGLRMGHAGRIEGISLDPPAGG